MITGSLYPGYRPLWSISPRRSRRADHAEPVASISTAWPAGLDLAQRQQDREQKPGQEQGQRVEELQEPGHQPACSPTASEATQRRLKMPRKRPPPYRVITWPQSSHVSMTPRGLSLSCFATRNVWLKHSVHWIMSGLAVAALRFPLGCSCGTGFGRWTPRRRSTRRGFGRQGPSRWDTWPSRRHSRGT